MSDKGWFTPSQSERENDIISNIFTARIRSMTGRYCFHRCLSVNISEGGVPGLRFLGGGTWSQIFWGGYLVSDFWGGGTWSQIFWGGDLVSDFLGGVPGLRFLGGVPGLRKLLWLHGGRYASCVHAGGLSCFP